VAPEAELRISNALERSASRLDLSGLQLSEVPVRILELDHLAELNLARNQLTELPDWLSELESLTRLNLSGNQIQRLPDWLAALTRLDSLSVTGNRLVSLPASIGRLRQLRTLSLARNSLTALPDSLGELQQLRDLDASSNELTDLPAAIGGLAQITDLDLSRNRLSRLPDEIGGLGSLLHLHLADNKLAILPDSIGGLHSLTRLDLTGNRLSTLPDQIGNLAALARLDLTGNEISVLPGRISDLQQLTRLDLASNRLAQLPPEIGELTRLANLNLNGNRLESLPPEIGRLSGLTDLAVSGNRLACLPVEIGALASLTDLDASANQLAAVPDSIGDLADLKYLDLAGNKLTELTARLGGVAGLASLYLSGNLLATLPNELGALGSLRDLDLSHNALTTVPLSLGQLESADIVLAYNPLAPELQAAYDDSSAEFKTFLRLLEDDGQYIHEAKLILVGEGGAGKSSLLAAMRGEDWIADRPTTHGVEIKTLIVSADDVSITLNGWDFGGQPIYRPTHQLFFSAPAIYLVVWNPRVGPERHFVEYWIDLIKHRAGETARVLVVATHGGPGERTAYLDEAGIRSRYGDIVIGFHHIDSELGLGIPELVASIAATACGIPHVGRWYPATWGRLRQRIAISGQPYLSYRAYETEASQQGLTPTSAKSLVRIANALGHWICHAQEITTSDLIIFKPDWLSTAISYVLDDADTIRANGLLPHARLPYLWNNPSRSAESRYPAELYPVFLQLMERFDISYRLASEAGDSEARISLVAQLVPAGRPVLGAWDSYHTEFEPQRQICEIVDAVTGDPVEPEGLMYQLIVRFHRFSLGRADYRSSVHWQSGMVLDYGYNGRALIRVERNRVSVSVRAAYPQFFLRRLTEDIRDHVRAFWRGLNVRIMVPCEGDCDGWGLFDLSKLTVSREMGRTEYPCSQCPRWLSIDSLLLGNWVPDTSDQDRLVRAVRQATLPGIAHIIDEVAAQGTLIRNAIEAQSTEIQRALSQAEERLRNLLHALDDEARDGPRLFSIAPVPPTVLRPSLATERVEITLWCEHARLPLYLLDPPGSRRGVYELKMPRKWLIKAAPWIQAVSLVIRSLLPVSLAALKIELPDREWQSLNDQLHLAEASLDALVDAGSELAVATGVDQDAVTVAKESAGSHVDGSLLRALHAYLREADAAYGGLERVRDRTRYLWVHPRFVDYYELPPPTVPED
jgi:Leucine-rich repeat (LRR) protein